jgi:hypothetical protein
MFVYDMGIVDYYNGMMPLDIYIRTMVNDNRNKDFVETTTHLTTKELKSFLVKCFVEIKSYVTYWEGDIRGLDEIAISAIPRSCDAPYKFIVFKQDNNGSSFLVSECQIFVYDDPEEMNSEMPTPRKNVTTIDLLRWFEESFDLVEDLFENALTKKPIPIKEHITAQDELMSDFEQIT